MKAARFPQTKTLDDFDFAFQRSVKHKQIAHLAQLDFIAEANNVIFLGPPGTGKTHLSIALGVVAARRGHRVAFATAHEWVERLAAARRAGKLDDELERLGRIPLVIVDEVGYIPFDPEAGALFFALVSSRYERRSLIVSSNKTFSAWGEIFGDPVAVAAMVDRLVHHAEVFVLRGDSYRLKGKAKAMVDPDKGLVIRHCRQSGHSETPAEASNPRPSGEDCGHFDELTAVECSEFNRRFVSRIRPALTSCTLTYAGRTTQVGSRRRTTNAGSIGRCPAPRRSFAKAPAALWRPVSRSLCASGQLLSLSIGLPSTTSS